MNFLQIVQFTKNSNLLSQEHLTCEISQRKFGCVKEDKMVFGSFLITSYGGLKSLCPQKNIHSVVNAGYRFQQLV